VKLRPCRGGDCAELLRSVDQDEGHLEIDAVLGNLAILHDDLLSLIHAPSTFLSVLAARAMPSMASSRLLFELEIISVTLAVDTSRLRQNEPFPLRTNLHLCQGEDCADLLTSRRLRIVSNVPARCAGLFISSISTHICECPNLPLATIEPISLSLVVMIAPIPGVTFI
jgi:hypothetical protein